MLVVLDSRTPFARAIRVAISAGHVAAEYTIVVVSGSATCTVIGGQERHDRQRALQPGGRLVFYDPASGSQSPITSSGRGDPYHEVMLSRSSSGVATGSVDGAQQFTFNDSDGSAVINPGGTVRFFRDDNVVPEEQTAGAVADIRLYDGLLPPPSVRR